MIGKRPWTIVPDPITGVSMIYDANDNLLARMENNGQDVVIATQMIGENEGRDCYGEITHHVDPSIPYEG